QEPEGKEHVSQNLCLMRPTGNTTAHHPLAPPLLWPLIALEPCVLTMDNLYQSFGIDRNPSPSFSLISANSDLPTPGGPPSTPDNAANPPRFLVANVNPESHDNQDQGYAPDTMYTPQIEGSGAAIAGNPFLISLPASKHGRADDSFEDEVGPRNPLPGHLLRALAADKCVAANLSVEQTQEIMAFCELSVGHMLVNLKIHLFKNENDLLKRYFQLYHRHPDFMTRLRTVVAAVIFAHNTPAYLNNITNSITEYIEQHLDIVALTPQSRDDPVDWATFKSSIAAETTEMRLVLKNKIDASILNNDDIYALTVKALMYEMRPKEEHWARFAFLRHCATEHKASGKTGKTFWPYIDEQLQNIRRTLKQLDPSERKQAETKYVSSRSSVTSYPYGFAKAHTNITPVFL
ncbi:hypothetical protein BD310DRAFT_818782, partial [Dichomitus squalens]